jgi:hypothetical protein
MYEKDQYCCLLFDEMSERISYLIRNLTALRDLRILEVGAGHATLQIMVLGLHQKFKQPEAYYHSCGISKAEILV